MASAGILVSEEVVHRAIETVIADNDSVSRKEASLSTLLTANCIDYTEVILALQSCFDQGMNARSFKEKAQRKFHALRVQRLPIIWKKITDTARIPALPALDYQAISRHLFNYFLVEHYKVLKPSTQTLSGVTILAEEENAIRYACGYVAMKLQKRFEKRNGEKASQFMECLSHMANSGDDSTYYDYTKKWIESVNRGGLFLVNDITLSFFKSVELKIQELLPNHLSSSGEKKFLIDTILSDPEVQFNWCMLATDITKEEDALELLYVIIECWVTMRGFALTSMWLEEYKRATAKNLKKRKGLRTELRETTQDT